MIKKGVAFYKRGDLISPLQAKSFALSVAEQGAGRVSPNPLVGCVFVDKSHKFISSGAHLKYGEEHAEINALAAFSDADLEGATVYVTLEPCAHQGKTGSCAQALAERPISKVVCGLEDPFELVSGEGFQILRSAGIEVEIDSEWQSDCERLAEIFLINKRQQRPFVSVKVGMSFDGKVALDSGESQWITGGLARERARTLRAHYDATLIGLGTLRADNPRLDFRQTVFAHKKNKIVIWDPKGEVNKYLPESQVLALHGLENIYIIGPVRVDGANNIQATEISSTVLKELFSLGLMSLFVEGGAATISHCLQNKIVDRLYAFVAPKILGGTMSWSRDLGLSGLSSAPQILIDDRDVIGNDLFFSAKLIEAAPEEKQ